MKQIPKKLSGFALKYIAMVSMLCDHANMLVIRRGFFAPAERARMARRRAGRLPRV